MDMKLNVYTFKMANRVGLSTFILAASLGGAGFACAQTVPATDALPSGYDQVDCTKSSVDYMNDPSLNEAEKLARMDQALQRSLNKFDECAIARKPENTSHQDQAQKNKADQAGTASAASNADKTSEAASGQAQGQSGAPPSQSPQTQNGTQAAQPQKQSSGTWSNPDAAPDANNATDKATETGQPGTVASRPGSGLSGTESGDQASPDANPEPALQGGSLSSSDMSGTESKPVQSTAIPGGGNSRDNTTQSGAADVEQRGGYGKASGNSPYDKNLNNGKLPEDIPPADNDSVLEAQIRQAAINEKDPVVQKRLWNEYRKYKGLPTIE